MVAAPATARLDSNSDASRRARASCACMVSASWRAMAISRQTAVTVAICSGAIVRPSRVSLISTRPITSSLATSGTMSIACSLQRSMSSRSAALRRGSAGEAMKTGSLRCERLAVDAPHVPRGAHVQLLGQGCSS